MKPLIHHTRQNYHLELFCSSLVNKIWKYCSGADDDVIACCCSHNIVMMAVLCHADESFEMDLKLLKLFNKQDRLAY